MKIGVYINQRPDAGGGFYEALNSIGKIDIRNSSKIFFTSNRACFDYLVEIGANAEFFEISYLQRLMLFIRYSILNKLSRIIPGNITPVKLLKKMLPTYNYFERKFIDQGIDIIFFTSPDSNIVYLEKINYCISVWDMAHIEIPFYPELRENFTFETRDFYYKRVLPKAYSIVVGHEECKKSLISKYNINEDKIFIIPFQASPKIRQFFDQNSIIKPAKIEGNYIFYPSQYSSHKNHRMVIDAFHEYYTKCPSASLKLVFVGSDQGTKYALKELAKNKNLSNVIEFLDFLSDEEIYSLYKLCTAVIVPSHIGPGTLPSLEALYLDKNLILPDYDFNLTFYGNQPYYYCHYDYKDLAELLLKMDATASTADSRGANKNLYKHIQNCSEVIEFNVRMQKFHNISRTSRLND